MTKSVRYNTGDRDMRPWGRWEVLATGNGFIVKKIDVDPGHILSLQSHDHRSEHWTILCGQAQVTLGEVLIDLVKDGSVFIPCGTKHRIRNSGDRPMSFLEIQTGDILDENDITRYNDEYGRAS